jgi:hypothetical protein
MNKLKHLCIIALIAQSCVIMSCANIGNNRQEQQKRTYLVKEYSYGSCIDKFYLESKRPLFVHSDNGSERIYESTCGGFSPKLIRSSNGTYVIKRIK